MTKRTRPRRITIRDYLKNPTAAAYDAMVEQMALGICRDAGLAELTRKYAIDALHAIGITRPRDPSAQLRKKRKTTNSQQTLDNAMADWVSSYPRD